MSEWKRFEVHLQDEILGVGQGLRTVEVQVGRKWVYVRRHVADGAKRVGKQARRFRILRSAWDQLSAKEITDV